MSKASAIVLALLTVIVSGVFLASGVFAQTKIDPSNTFTNRTVPKEISDLKEGVNIAKTEGKNNLASLADSDLGYKLASLTCIMSTKLSDCPEKTNADGSQVQGMLETGAQLIGGVYSAPPASTQTYVAYVMENMRIGTPAYAQGVGFSALSPVLSVWVVMRNVAYFFFVIAFIFMGFAIMGNGKWLTKQAITVQQAIPSIIVALITVTFSYAIAALLIDGMYLVMFLIAGLFGKSELISGNVFQMTGRLIGSNVAGTSANALGQLVEAAIGGGVFGAIAGVITNIGATVIILLVLVFNTFKLFFNLLKVYVELILNIAFAPLILMMGAIPGQNPFGKWVKDIVGNLAVFPAILLILIMFDVIRDSTTQTNGGFLPPYIAGYTDSSVLPLLAGLALVLALPQVVDEVRKAFGVSQGGIFGNLVQAGIKNAQAQRGRATGILGGAALGATLAGGGAFLGYKAAKASGLSRAKTVRNMGAMAAAGAAIPMALPLGVRVGKLGSRVGQGLRNYEALGAFVGGDTGDLARGVAGRLFGNPGRRTPSPTQPANGGGQGQAGTDVTPTPTGNIGPANMAGPTATTPRPPGRNSGGSMPTS